MSTNPAHIRHSIASKLKMDFRLLLVLTYLYAYVPVMMASQGMLTRESRTNVAVPPFLHHYLVPLHLWTNEDYFLFF
jgi:hypothetical protein